MCYVYIYIGIKALPRSSGKLGRKFIPRHQKLLVNGALNKVSFSLLFKLWCSHSVLEVFLYATFHVFNLNEDVLWKAKFESNFLEAILFSLLFCVLFVVVCPLLIIFFHTTSKACSKSLIVLSSVSLSFMKNHRILEVSVLFLFHSSACYLKHE